MSAALPDIVVKLIPRLGSPFDNEVVATARAIERSLRSSRMDWHDLVQRLALPAPWAPPRQAWTPPPPKANAETYDLLYAIAREDGLNEFIRQFVGSMLERDSLDDLSPKQQACLDRIIAAARRRGVRP